MRTQPINTQPRTNQDSREFRSEAVARAVLALPLALLRRLLGWFYLGIYAVVFGWWIMAGAGICAALRGETHGARSFSLLLTSLGIAALCWGGRAVAQKRGQFVGLTSPMWIMLPIGCFIAGLLLGLAL